MASGRLSVVERTASPGEVDALWLDSGGDVVEAVVPGSVVEVSAKVVGQHFQQLFDEHLQQSKYSGCKVNPLCH